MIVRVFRTFSIRDLNVAVSNKHKLKNVEKIGDVGVAELVELLRSKQSVTELHLQKNSITDVGAATLSEYLSSSRSIKVVDLSSNRISSKGMQV